MKNINPLVSVIIIAYNNSDYIIKTLESVKDQTYDNIELIISDDCSKDNTVELCKNWIDKNKDRFTNTSLLTTSINTGTSANSNRSIRASNGSWLKSISGDDLLLSNCISDNLEFALGLPDKSFIVSDMMEIDDDGNVVVERKLNQGLNFFSKLSTAKKQLKTYSRWPVFLNIPSIFCKKEFVEKVNFCDEEFRIYEDMTIVNKLINMGIKLHYLRKVTVSYRIHKKAASRDLQMETLREEELYNYFKKYQMKNLSYLNPLDLSVYYEHWLRFKYKGSKGLKGISLLRKLSLYYWYMKFNGISYY